MILETFIVGIYQENCYLVGSEKTSEAAVIDPGDEAEKILQFAQQNKLDITKILLTHCHCDHVGGVKRLKRATDAKIYLHRADLFLYEKFQEQADFLGFQTESLPKPDYLINDKEIIEIGDLQFKVIHVPGHSPGSVCYFTDSKIFVGDLIFAGSIGRTDLPGGSYKSLVRSARSKIFTLPDEIEIYPGHGPPTKVGIEKERTLLFF